MSESVTLREITPDNEAAVRALAAPYGQKLFMVSASDAPDEAAVSPDARP
jgi:hypothetical protein